MKTTKRLIALVVMMLILLNSMMPVITFAEEPVAGEETTDVATEYKIEAEKEWDVSVNEDGSVIARWKYSDRSLTVSGTGKIKDSTSSIYGRYKDLVETIIIEDGITEIGYFCFSNFTNVKTIIIPDCVLAIGNNTFSECPKLENINLPSNLKVLRCLFAKCKNLKEVNIPENLEEINITSGFYYCEGITTLSLPKTVKTIQIDNGTNYLKSVYIDESNEFFMDIDGVIYDKECKTLLFYPPEKEDKTYEVPSTVTKIGDYAFNRNKYIEKITLPEGITEIGKEAFQCCSSLNEVNLSDGITAIKEGTFFGCTSLKEIELPDGITEIGREAFESCESLESIEIPSGVKEIPENCFRYCYSLKSVNIPVGVRRIRYQAFYECLELREINLPMGMNYIDERSFGYCDGFLTVYIPNTVAFINGDLFEDHVIDDGRVTIICETNSAIHDYAETNKINYFLVDDGEVQNVTGSEYKLEKHKVWDITEDESSEERLLLTWNYDDRSFTVSGKGEMKDFDEEERPYKDYLKVAKKVIIESGEKSLCNNAFSHSDIKEIIVSRDYKYDENNEMIYEPIEPNAAFYSTLLVEKIVLSKNVINFNVDFSEFRYLKEIDYDGEWDYINFKIVDGIIYDYEQKKIYKCLSDSTEIVIPDTVTDIDDYAFYNCTNVEKVIMPDSVKTIGDSAFYGCTNLKEIRMSNNIKTLEGWAFENCKSLESIELPNTIERYGTSLFKGCSSLKTVIWSESMKSIPQSTFENCSSLENIELPNSVESISYRAFINCVKLKSINLPNSINNIAMRSFSASGIERLELPSSLVNISKYAFDDCSELETIILSDNVEKIEDNAFEGCEKLKTIEIPSSVTEIGKNVFKDCSSLESITVAEENENYKVVDGALYSIADNKLVAIPQGYINSIVENDVENVETGAFNIQNLVIVKKNSPAHLYAENNKIGYLLRTVESEDYEIDNNLIEKISPNTKIDDLLLEIDAADYKFLSKDGTELNKDAVIGTNGLLVLYDKIGYNIVVKGDLNGDGKVTVNDLASTQRKILDNDYELDDLAFKAGDTDGSGAISVKDLASIQRYLLTGKGLKNKELY